MKALLFSLIVTLLMVGCFESSDPLDDKESLDEIIAEAIHSNTLKDRIEDGEKLEYAPNEQTPYTGWAKNWYDKKRIHYLLQFKDGKLMTAVSWKPNGEKCPVTNVKDGNGVWVEYAEDGTERTRWNYKDGEVVD